MIAYLGVALAINILLLSGPEATARQRAGRPQLTRWAQPFMGWSLAAQDDKDVRALAPGSPIERELSGGEAHLYRLTLISGQYLRLSVIQKGINVIVKLSGPEGNQIAEVNNQNNVQLQEEVSLVADAPGDYRFEVRAAEKTALVGSYEIRIAEPRDASSQDHARIVPERVYAQAELLRLQGSAESLQKAITKYEEALPLWRAIGDGREQANTLHSLGLAHRLLGETQKALEYYNKALPLRRETGDLYGEAMTTNNIGSVYYNLGDNQNALNYYNQALGLRRAARDIWGESVTLSNIGTIYGVLGDNQKALEYFNRSLPLRREARDRAGEGETLSNMGNLYSFIGERQKALDYNNQSLKLRREAGDKRGEAFSLINIASVHLRSNEYKEALDYFSQALSLAKVSGDRRGQALTLSNIGVVYIELGEPQQALDYYSQALLLFQAIGDRMNEASVLNRIAAIYKQTGNYQKALEYFDQSLLLSRAVGNRSEQATSLTGVGGVSNERGEKQKALEYYNQALTLHRQVGNRRGEAGTLNNVGAIYEHLGDRQKALEYFGQALLLERAIGDRSGEATTLLGIARIERKRSNLVQARAYVQAALELVESDRTRIPGEALRASYLATKQSGYQFYIDLLVQLDQAHPSEGYAAAALLASERTRARSLLETLGEARADIRSGVDPVLLDRERYLQQRLNARAERLMQLLNGKHTEEQAAAARKELDSLVTDYQQVQAEIRSKSPRYAALTQSQPLDLKTIQTELVDSDTLLLEYSLGTERSFLWAVTPTSITSHVLPKRAEIETAARRVYDLLTARNHPAGESSEQRAARVKQAEAEYGKVAAYLSQILLGPVATQLGTKRLIIVSEGALQYVPFGALPVPISLKSGAMSLESEKRNESQLRSQDSRHLTPDSRLPLIVEHEIVTLPSASVLAVLRRELLGRKSAPLAVAVLADPVFRSDDPRIAGAEKRERDDAVSGSAVVVSARRNVSAFQMDVERSAKESGVMGFKRLRFSRQEAEAITASAPGGKSLKAIDFAANRATATSQELRRYRVLHFATHGLLNSQHPELSGIVLSLVDERGHPQDGFLRLHEIYNLKLEADLVVLSACQTALGKEIKGEGLVGLTRGFMYAGAPRVVASLWNVDDRATAELMKRFYGAMFIQKMRPAAALRAAQTSLRREKGWAAPYYWAGFTLQGEWK